MTPERHIRITMPDLSPEAAYALSDWIAEIAHEVDLYYGDQIRSYLARCDEEMAALEREIEQQRQRENDGDQTPSF